MNVGYGSLGLHGTAVELSQISPKKNVTDVSRFIEENWDVSTLSIVLIWDIEMMMCVAIGTGNMVSLNICEIS
jgi:hypothetical protein